MRSKSSLAELGNSTNEKSYTRNCCSDGNDRIGFGCGPRREGAPPAAPLYNWTGFYIFSGGSGGLWNANGGVDDTVTGACIICTNTRTGGDGWFGTVGAGYDWQTGPSWVIGIFGDGTWGSLKGNIGDATIPAVGTVKMETAWAAGARVGYLIAPNVLSYVNGGYTGTYWTGSTLLDSLAGIPSGFHMTASIPKAGSSAAASRTT